MAKGKAAFSLHKRPASKKEELKKRLGKSAVKYVFYVQFRKPDGSYSSALSTGQTSRGAADGWARNYMKKGNIPTHRGFTFKNFASDWWVLGKSAYLKEKERTGHARSPRYVQESKRNLEKHLIPFFGPMKMTGIKFADVRKWMLDQYEIHSMNPATINRSLATLKVMMKEAVREGYIQSSPCEGIGIFKEKPRAKTIPSLEEARRLFTDSALQTVWKSDLQQFAINMLAASTGMRLGEIQGLQRQHVHDKFIEVVTSWSRKFGLKDTKNHTKRLVTIPTRTSSQLKKIMEISANKAATDFVFHKQDSLLPFDGKDIDDAFYEALDAIDISSAQRKDRNITFHSWRYFFNTMCRSEKVPDIKTRLIMGHKTAMMTDRYTSMNLEEFREVSDLQERLLEPVATSEPEMSAGDGASAQGPLG